MGAEKTPGYKYVVFGIMMLILGIAFCAYQYFADQPVIVTPGLFLSAALAVLGALIWIVGELVNISDSLAGRTPEESSDRDDE